MFVHTKYLGLVFTTSGGITTALDDLRSRTIKAYMRLFCKQLLGVQNAHRIMVYY